MNQLDMFNFARQLSGAISSEVPAYADASTSTSPLQGLLSNKFLDPVLTPDILTFEGQQSALTSIQSQQTSSSNNTLPRNAHTNANHARHTSSDSMNSANSLNSVNSLPNPASHTRFQSPFPLPVTASIPATTTSLGDWSKTDYSYQTPTDLATSFQRPISSASLPSNLSWFDFDFNTSQEPLEEVFGSGTYQQLAFDGSAIKMVTVPWDPLHLLDSNQENRIATSPSLTMSSIPGDASVGHISSTINDSSNGLEATVGQLACATPMKTLESHFVQLSRKRKRSQENVDAVESPAPALPIKDDLDHLPSEKQRGKQRRLDSPRSAAVAPLVPSGLTRNHLVCPMLRKGSRMGKVTPSPARSSPQTPLTTSVYPPSPRYYDPQPYPPTPHAQMTPPLENATITSNSSKSSPVVIDPVADYLKVPQPTPVEQYACSIAKCDFQHISSENKLRIHEFKIHGIEHPSLFFCREPECAKRRSCFPTQAALKQHRRRDAENEAKKAAKEGVANGEYR